MVKEEKPDHQRSEKTTLVSQTDSKISIGIGEEYDEQPDIKWINIIFLVFHPFFEFIIFIVVLTKSIVGPIQGVFPWLFCTNFLHGNNYAYAFKTFYVYVCDFLYAFDTCLHIVHRQVAEEAAKREHAPKTAGLLFVDMIALTPLFRLVSSDVCVPVQFFPNILAFTEVFVFYRVVKYLKLSSTHSTLALTFGYGIIMLVLLNFISCLNLLLTINGFCGQCKESIYDWRVYVMYRFSEVRKSMPFPSYLSSLVYVQSYVLNTPVDSIFPNTQWEYFFCVCLIMSGFVLNIFVFTPKLFAEFRLNLKLIAAFYPRVKRVISQTKRRNPHPAAYKAVEDYYMLIWKKHKGLISMPGIIQTLPRYLSLDIKLDMFWPLFYHSPTFRDTSQSFKRYTMDLINIEFKLPGERFYTGRHCITNLYYVRKGIIQIISDDDSMTPLISLTDGTLLGDVGFQIPSLSRKVSVRCLNYCEVYTLTRADIIKALHKFPTDRLEVMQRVKGRVEHARSLYMCKQAAHGLDRTDDEGVLWIKQRWWEISNMITRWKTRYHDEQSNCALPAENTSFHCAKYIGQLVLCSENQLQRKSLFVHVKFPWILAAHSNFQHVRHIFMRVVVFVVLIVFPVFSLKKNQPVWFLQFRFLIDFIYIIDLCLTMVTTTEKKGNVRIKLSDIVFARLKTKKFFFDILSTAIVEKLFRLFSYTVMANIAQFTRLIKTYILFEGQLKWNKGSDPLRVVWKWIALSQFVFYYLFSHYVYIINDYFPFFNTPYLFGPTACNQYTNSTCEDQVDNTLSIHFMIEQAIAGSRPKIYAEIILGGSFCLLKKLLSMCLNNLYLAELYSKYLIPTNYRYYVTNLKRHYIRSKIHPDLLKRLDRYLVCHWRYFKGGDVMIPNIHKNDPYDIYWKTHGEIAQKVIKSSRLFDLADSAMVRELAKKSKFLIIPKMATIVLFGVQSKGLTWLLHGAMKMEYNDDNGEVVKVISTTSELLSLGAVLYNKTSIITFIAETDCEILYLDNKDFFNVIFQYPEESSYLQTCNQEFSDSFDKLVLSNLKKHRDYQKKLREKIFRSRKSVLSVASTTEETQESNRTMVESFSIIFKDPESVFMQRWHCFRAITVMVDIIVTASKGGCGAGISWYLTIIDVLCLISAMADITFKMFLPYYNDKGIVVTDNWKCFRHYTSRGFLLDFIGIAPLAHFLQTITHKDLENNFVYLLMLTSSYAPLYIVIDYFNYLANVPTMNSLFIHFIKWQTLMLLVLYGMAGFFLSNCITFIRNDKDVVLSMKSVNRSACWYPDFLPLNKTPTLYQLQLVFAQSLNIAQNGMTRVNISMFKLSYDQLEVTLTFIFLGFFFWYIHCQCNIVLFMYMRGDTLFRHGVTQLRGFLESERVDQSLLTKVDEYFTYMWRRTKGLTSTALLSERVGIVFRQDLNYYFYKKTLELLDTALRTGESVLRQLANVAEHQYILPNMDIMREMDLNSDLFLIHRGKVIITRNNKFLTILSKGSIFGQLTGTNIRPVRVTAQAVEHTDVLTIPVKEFQNIINDDVRALLAKRNDVALDFLHVKNQAAENAYNTIPYIMRGIKTIQLPLMTKPRDISTNLWYRRWLCFNWMILTTIIIFSTITFSVASSWVQRKLFYYLYIFDAFYFVHFVTDFFTMEIVVERNKCVYKYVKKYTQWGFYLDLLALIVPLFQIIWNKVWVLQMFRLLRCHTFVSFYQNFCKDSYVFDFISPFGEYVVFDCVTSNPQKNTLAIFKCVLIFLLMHVATCGWMYVACKESFVDLKNELALPHHINETVDYSQWTRKSRRPTGCARGIMTYEDDVHHQVQFLVPTSWLGDYMLSFYYIIVLHTRTSMSTIFPRTLRQTYYKIFVSLVMTNLEIYISSNAICAIYTKFQELYEYDYQVKNLITYLNQSGLSGNLIAYILKYTRMLWQRQRGTWLPEITYTTPICLREDILGALYMHHLKTPPLLKKLPDYVLRQLVVRLKRVVIFPGQYIVEEGDINPCMFFIHEGEVEKWYTNSRGDAKMATVMGMNSYFGLLPGLFPNMSYQFSYYSRTVVDLIYLNHEDWQDLLDGYPDHKYSLYMSAKKLKNVNR